MDFESGADGGAIVKGSSGASSAWTVLYEKDLRTLPDSQPISAGASSSYTTFTLDGISWGVHLNSQATGQPSLTVKAGVGIVCRYATIKSGGTPYGGTHLNVRSWLVPGYDAAKWTAVQMRFYRGPELNVGGTYTYDTLLTSLVGQVAVGVWEGTEAFGYGPGNGNETCGFDGTAQIACRNTANANLCNVYNIVNRGAPNSTPDLVRDWVFAVAASPWSLSPTAATDSEKDRNLHAFYFQRDVFTDALPAMEDMQPFYTSGQAAFGAPYDQHLMGAYFGASASEQACAVQQVRVLQRAVKSL